MKQFFSLRCWVPISQISFSMIMCQFLYFFYMTGTAKTPYSFQLSNLLKEFLFTFAITFLVSNLTFLFFEMPLTNLLLKLFRLSRRRDIVASRRPTGESQSKIGHPKKETVKFDYTEINNNNPDFKPFTKMD